VQVGSERPDEVWRRRGPAGGDEVVTDELGHANRNGDGVDDFRCPKSISWREKNWGDEVVPSRCLASLGEAHVGGAAAISPAKFSELLTEVFLCLLFSLIFVERHGKGKADRRRWGGKRN
jgi:hypothetical protein